MVPCPADMDTGPTGMRGTLTLHVLKRAWCTLGVIYDTQAQASTSRTSGLASSYKRVKGRSHTVEKRKGLASTCWVPEYHSHVDAARDIPWLGHNAQSLSIPWILCRHGRMSPGYSRPLTPRSISHCTAARLGVAMDRLYSSSIDVKAAGSRCAWSCACVSLRRCSVERTGHPERTPPCGFLFLLHAFVVSA